MDSLHNKYNTKLSKRLLQKKKKNIHMKKGIILSISTVAILVIAYVFYPHGDKRAQQEALIINEIQSISAKASVPDEGKKFGMPSMASRQEYYKVFDPALNRVPQERLRKAHKQMQNLTNSTTAKDVEMEWEIIPSDMGGRTKALMWDPNTENKVWAGAATGGIWYNNNIQSEDSPWQISNELLPSLSISSFAYDPNNTNMYYAGTGEASTAIITYRESSGRGVGLYQSTDAGNSWQLMESTQNFPYINDVVVRNEAGNSVIYVAVVSGKYKGQEYTSDADAGLYRSADAGSSWQQVLPNIEGLEVTYAPADIELGADGKIYIGTMPNMEGKGGAVILCSDSGTAGSWSVYKDIQTEIEADHYYQLPGRVMISAAPSNANIVYAIIGAGYIGNDSFPYFKGNYILKSTDKGASWTKLSIPHNGEDWANLSWHAFAIDVNPNNTDHFYIGGLDVYHSFNAGTNYTHVSDWSMMYYGGGDNYVHADIHAISFKPGSSTEAIFGTDGGVFYTANADNNGPVFEQHNKSYSSLQFYTCAIHPQAGNHEYLGGLQDNGTVHFTGQSAFTINDMVHGGDGAYCFFYYDDPDYYVSSHYHNNYSIEHNGEDYANVYSGTGTFVSPAAMSASTNNFYCNAVDEIGNYAKKILKVSNHGYDEEIINLSTEGNAWFTAIACSPYTETGHDNLFVGDLVGRLYKVEEAQGNQHTTIPIGDDNFPTAAISCIAIGGSEDSLLVTFSNYGVSSIWQSYDGGATWQEKEGNLPDMPIRWAIYQSQSAKQAMIATELGIWVCADLTAEEPIWEPSIYGMSNVRVDMLQQRPSDKKVLAATHGRGLYTTTFYPLDSDGISNTDTPIANLQLYPNPCTEVVTINSPTQNASQLQITDMQGKLQKQLSISPAQQTINVKDLTKGIYMLSLWQDGKCIAQQKLSKQ